MLDLVLFLKTVPLFKDLPLETVARAAASAETVTLLAGEPVHFPSGPDARVCVVRRGRVEVLVEDCIVDTREITDLLGASSLASLEEDTFFTRCSCDCELLALPIRVIHDLAAEDPRVLWAMLREATRMQQQSYARLAEVRRTVTPGAARPAGRSLRLVHCTAPAVRDIAVEPGHGSKFR